MGLIYKILLVFGTGASAWGHPPMDVAQDVIVSEQGPEAKQEAFRKAVEETSMKLITETVGTDAVEKQAARIKQVLSRSDKYILFIKGSNPEPVPEGSRIKVEMKISLDNLEALLRENGMLQGSSRSPKLIPIIDWQDDASTIKYAWWVEPPSSRAAKLWSKFLTSLQTRLKGRNVRLVDGMALERVPPALRKRNLNRTEQAALAKIFDASLIQFGEVQFSKTEDGDRAQVQTELVEASGQHTLGSGQVTVGPAKDGPEQLVGRISEAMNEQLKAAQGSGRMNLASLKLVVQGLLSYQNLELVRKELLTQVVDIRALKERMFAPGEFVFDAETNKSAADLVNAIRKAHFSQFKVDAQEGAAGSLMVKISNL